MNFVAQVEDHLRDLGAEARKNHPGVKEASERAILHLRSLQTQYVAAVRRAGASSKSAKQQHQQCPPSSGNSTSSLPPQHPTTALFRSQDVLRPFLLACNYPDAPCDLILIALESIQLLLRGDAVCPEDGIQIGRVLVIQSWGCAGTLGLASVGGVGGGRGDAGGGAGSGMGGMFHAASSGAMGALGAVLGSGGASADGSPGVTAHHNHHHYQSHRSAKEDQSIALKMMQTVTMLVDSRSIKLTGDLLGACLLMCLLLGAGQTHSEHVGGSTMGASIRERFVHSSAAAATAKDGSGGTTATGNIKRAALATMNQLLSILFERAKDVMLAQTQQLSAGLSFSSESSILSVAERMLTDLCTLVSRKFSSPSQQSAPADLVGPFSVAAKEGLSPSPTTSLALVDMVLRQSCGDLFGVCFDFYGSCNDDVNNDMRTKNTGVDFATRIIIQTFQLGQSLLGSQYCYHVTKFAMELSLKEASKPSASDLMDFCLFYYTAAMVTTLLTSYLSSDSERFYESFDAYGGVGDVPMSEMALDMMKQLVSFVAEATEAYHKSADFEDGYIFTQSERESFDIGATNSTNNHTASTRTLAQVPSQPLPVSSISNETLWRAFLALDVLNHVVSSHLEQTSWIDSVGGDNSNEKFTASSIAIAASDFATISASNREGILHLLLAAHADDQKGTEAESNGEKPTSAFGDAQISESENSNAAAAVASKVTDALVIDSVEIPLCDAGVTTWLAFRTVLSSVKSLNELAVSNEIDSDARSCLILSGLVNGLFPPSVSMLQHFIRRMFGSPVIVTHTLSSYQELACASMTIPFQSTNERRQAILMSLCKLCLPSWGKRRPNCQLKESNIDSLWTMLWIVHSNYEQLSDEWDIILSTLDQLAIISIWSPKLHSSYAKKTAEIAGCFIRLPTFSTCFTHVTLSQFITSLVKLSEAVSFESLSEQSTDISRENSESTVGDAITDNTNADKESSIGGKLMSWTGGLAGRAFGGATAPSSSTNNRTSFNRSASTGPSQFSKIYSEDLRETACSQMGSMKISTPRATIRKIPLPLLLIAVVTEANSYRLSVIEETVANHLCEIVARSSSAELRSFAMEVLIHFMPLSLSPKSEISLKFGIRPLMVPDREDKNESPLEVHPIEDASKPEASGQPEKVDSPKVEPKLLSVLCQTIQHTTQAETANTTLQALYGVLEGAGHNLSGGNLIIVINTLSVLSGCDSSDNGIVINRSTRQWANVSTLAFQNLKLILDDFLESDSPLKSTEARDAILDCCVAFGRSQHDVNTSLTATGMLWSLADRDSSPGTLDIVLSKLAFLAMDSRPELRNCSVNTLFSCVVGLGDHFTDDQWEKCLNDTIFGVMRGISKNKKSVVYGGANDERYKVAVHHSRDSASKQWATTQILVLRGLERVMRLLFSRLLDTLLGTLNEPWFLQTWNEILQVSFDSATMAGERETLDMRLAGVELMVLCAQLSCRAGMAAASSAARVGTNMEVVGGALRSVRAAVEEKIPKTDELRSVQNRPEVNLWRQRLFDFAFDNLCNFQAHLEENGAEEDERQCVTLDSLLTQVLTKMTGELAKLYECCKNDEMAPGPCELQLDIFIKNDDGYESRFLQLLIEIGKNAGSDKNSRYLNQVQRGVMSLLQGMASNSSLRAFKALATISGDYMFVRPKALSKSNNEGKDDHGKMGQYQSFFCSALYLQPITCLSLSLNRRNI